MPIKLNGETGGSVSFDAPDNTSPSGTDVTLTLPTSAGSAGQYLRNSSTAGTLEFGTIPGSFTSYAVIADEKASNGDGGTFTSGAWRTRDLNTELFDPDSIVSISSNQFVLGTAGTYLIRFSAPACQVGSHQTKLYDITGTADVEHGSSEFAYNSANSQTRSEGYARVTITASNTYEIRHRAGVTRADYGLGVGSSGSHTWGSTVYTLVEIYKEA